MGKANRRKKRDRDFAETPIRVINEDTGEVIEEFYDPKVVKYLSDQIAAGKFKTKEDVTAWINKGLDYLIAEKQKKAPHDGDTQHA